MKTTFASESLLCIKEVFFQTVTFKVAKAIYPRINRVHGWVSCGIITCKCWECPKLSPITFFLEISLFHDFGKQIVFPNIFELFIKTSKTIDTWVVKMEM